MPNMFDCIQAAIDGGELDPAKGKFAQDEFLQLTDRYSANYPRDIAETMAADDLKLATKKAATKRRHATIAQLQTMRRMKALVDDTVAAGVDPTLLPKALLSPIEGSGIVAENVRFTRDALNDQFHGMLNGLLSKHSKNLVGSSRDQAGLMNVVHELFGETTGDPVAKNIADAVTKTRNRARSLFNIHGGDMGKLENYGIQHTHNQHKLRTAGFDAWRTRVGDALDWSRIEDHRTGKPFAAKGDSPSPAATEQFLRKVYDNITTGGWIDRAPSMTVGGKALYNQHSDARILHFKSADDWMMYNNDFGDANPFEAIVSQLNGFSRDIALMRVLGPNPKLGLEFMIQSVQKHAAVRLDGEMEIRLNKRGKEAKTMLAHVTGEANMPLDTVWANFFAGTRNILTGAQLGAAVLTAPASDMVTQSFAAKNLGMSPTNIFKNTGNLISKHATRETAAAMGYVADTLANSGSASARYLGDVWAPELTEKITDFVLRASGLSYWTDMSRTAFKMEFSAHLARNAERAFEDMEPALRGALADRGITAADWDNLRGDAGMFVAPNGSKFLTPFHWLEHTDLPRAEAEGLSIKLHSVILEQMDFAVPSVSLEGRSAVLGDTKPGSFSGELLRSAFMYKNYMTTIMLNQYRRTMSKPDIWSRTRYFASLATGLTLAGGVAVQLKEVAKGRDPRNMNPFDNPKFWAEAGFQGGGFGIFGDFIRAEQNRMGGGIAETLAGPVVGMASDVLGAAVTNTGRALQGKETMLTRDLTNMASRYVPGSTLWYTRLAQQRIFMDTLHEAFDPDAVDYWRKQEKRRAKTYDNGSWWLSGDLAPNRAPNFSNAVGR